MKSTEFAIMWDLTVVAVDIVIQQLRQVGSGLVLAGPVHGETDDSTVCIIQLRRADEGHGRDMPSGFHIPSIDQLDHFSDERQSQFVVTTTRDLKQTVTKVLSASLSTLSLGGAVNGQFIANEHYRSTPGNEIGIIIDALNEMAELYQTEGSEPSPTEETVPTPSGKQLTGMYL